jgi:hypothetical protein
VLNPLVFNTPEPFLASSRPLSHALFPNISSGNRDQLANGASANRTETAASWDGAGAVWFKIFSQGPNISPSGLTWPSQGAAQVTTKIPSCIPSGDYLLRVEHIALHR